MSTTLFMPNGAIHLHRHDLPDGLSLGPMVAVDTETMGLNPHRDRLCLVQLSGGDGHAHLVHLLPPHLGGRGFDCPNLARLLAEPTVTKLMHFARFDVAMLQHSLEGLVRHANRASWSRTFASVAMKSATLLRSCPITAAGALAAGESLLFRYPTGDDPCILVRTKQGAYIARQVTPLDEASSESWAREIASRYTVGRVTEGYVAPDGSRVSFLVPELGNFWHVVMGVGVVLFAAFGWTWQRSRRA